MVSNCPSLRDGKTLRRSAAFATLRVSLSERWLSGLRRTPGKREYLNSTVGSNPSLSAKFPLSCQPRAGSVVERMDADCDAAFSLITITVRPGVIIIAVAARGKNQNHARAIYPAGMRIRGGDLSAMFLWFDCGGVWLSGKSPAALGLRRLRRGISPQTQQ